jgi:hypothetical protein
MKLPKEFQLVLAKTKDGKIWLLYYNPAGYWEDQYGFPHTTPVSWMKIPKI